MHRIAATTLLALLLMSGQHVVAQQAGTQWKWIRSLDSTVSSVSTAAEYRKARLRKSRKSEHEATSSSWRRN
jgi:hypothetical protein